MKDYCDVNQSTTNVFSFFYNLAIKHLKLLLSTTIIINLIVFLIIFFMDNIYRSESVLISISQNNNAMSTLGGLASAAGINLPSSVSDDIYKIETVLRSKTIREEVVKSLDLIKKLNEKPIPKKRDPLAYTCEQLQKITLINVDRKSGVITISAEHKDPSLAQSIVTSYIENLTKILNDKSFTVAKFNRIFLEQQTKQAYNKLLNIQNELIDYQKETKLLLPDAQVKGMLDLYGSLVARKVDIQVRLKSLEKALDSNNPQIKSLKDQLTAIENEINSLQNKVDPNMPALKNLPDKSSRYSQIALELAIARSVYENLVKFLEQAKLEEARENIYIQVIDPPNFPDVKIKPKRKLIMLVSFICSIFLSLIFLYFYELAKNKK